MRTTSLLTVSRRGGGSARGSVCRGCLPGGCLARVGVSSQVGVWPCDLWYMLGHTHISAPLVNRMTDTCKNITLPQTSFAGGKKKLNSRGGRDLVLAVVVIRGWVTRTWTVSAARIALLKYKIRSVQLIYMDGHRIGRSKGGGAPGTRPLSVQILSFSCSFRQKSSKKWVFDPKSGVGTLKTKGHSHYLSKAGIEQLC